MSLMERGFPRCVGFLTALWGLLVFRWPGSGWVGFDAWVLVWSLLAIASISLLAARHVPVGAGLLTLGAALHLFAQPSPTSSPITLLGWFGLILFATEGRPASRALLVRVCASCVYGATALAKLNPSFLAGDAFVRIANTRSHMAWSLDLSLRYGWLLAWLTVLTEAWLAVGLWSTRTRRLTAAVGVTLHLTLIPVAAPSWTRGVVFLTVLNLGLVATYPAFWSSITPTSEPEHPRAQAPSSPPV